MHVFSYRLALGLAGIALAAPLFTQASLPILDMCGSPVEVGGKYYVFGATERYKIGELDLPPEIRISNNGTTDILVAYGTNGPHSKPVILETTMGRYKLTSEYIEGKGNFTKFKWDSQTQTWIPQDENSIGGYTAIPLQYIVGVPTEKPQKTVGTTTTQFVIKALYGDKPIEIHGSREVVGAMRMCTDEEKIQHDQIAAMSKPSFLGKVFAWFFNFFK